MGGIDEALAPLARCRVDQTPLGATGAKAADRFLAAQKDALGVDVQIEIPFPQRDLNLGSGWEKFAADLGEV